MSNKKSQFSLTGITLAVLIISMTAVGFGMFVTQMEDAYTLPGANISLTSFNKTGEIKERLDVIRNESLIGGEASKTDIIGSYFKTGYEGMVVAGKSYGLMNEIIGDAGESVPALNVFGSYIMMIILIIILVGIVLSVLLKMWI